MSQCRVPWLVRMLYTHNPFYLISACLFVYGLKLLFRAGNSAMLFQRGTVEYMQPAGLLGSLVAVTLLMAVTAVLIVRLGRVWEDARSLVLIVLLMLLAISVSNDEIMTMAAEQEQGLFRIAGMILVSSLIAVGMVELLIRGLGVRLSWLWRMPLHGLLALFFLWPVLLLPEIMPFSASQVRWLIAAFPTAAAAVSLLLLPGIRKGSGSVRNNGTPWTWPWLPWTPFVFLAVAICFRSYSLTISFDAPAYGVHFWDTMFGLYMLVPFFVAAAIVLIEIGIVEGRPRLASRALTLSPVLLLMAWPWGVPWGRLPSYHQFASEVIATLGSPVFLTLIALIAVSGWAWWRGVPRGEFMTVGLLLLASGLNPDTGRYPNTSLLADHVSVWPIITLALMKLISGFFQNRTGQILAGLMILAGIPLVVTLPAALEPWRTFLSLHLCFAAVLTVIVISAGPQFLRRLNAVQLMITLVLGVLMLWGRNQTAGTISAYAVGMTTVSLACFRLLKERWYLIVSAFQCTAGLLSAGGASVWVLSTASMETGLRQVIFGGLSFLAAVLISILKSDAGRRLRLHLLTWRRSISHWLNETSPSTVVE